MTTLGWRHAFFVEQAHAPGNAALADQAAMFDEGVRTACTGRGRSVPALPADAGRRMLDAVPALDARWQQVPWHGTLELELPDA